MGSKFSMEQMTTKLSARSRMTSSSYSFQPITDSSIRTSCTGREVQAAARQLLELLVVVGDAAAGAAEGEGGADHRGKPRHVQQRLRLVEAPRHPAPRHLEADASHRLLEELAVLADLHRLAARPDEADAQPVEDAAPAQLHRQVEGGLSAHRGQHGVGPLALQDRGQGLRGQGLDVGGVRVLGVGHDRGRVRVHERHPQALLLEGLDGLGAGVVELAGLADHDGAGADDEDGLEARVFGHSAGEYLTGPRRPSAHRGHPRRWDRLAAEMGSGLLAQGPHRGGTGIRPLARPARPRWPGPFVYWGPCPRPQ